MAPIQYGSSSDIGRATLICGWLFGSLAILSVCLAMWIRLKMQGHCGLDDIILWITTIISVALLIQTTWAIVDKGQGQHIENESRSGTILVIKVSWAL